MKPLHRCLKASLTTILLPIVFTSVELPGEQHTLPGSNTRENSRCHTLTRSSPRLMLYLTFDLNTLHDTWFSSGTIHERPRGVFLFSFFFLWRGIVTHPHVSRLHRYASNDERRSTPAQHTLNRSTPVSGVECPRLRTSFASFPVYSSGLFGESLRDEGIIDIWGLFSSFNKMIYFFPII